MSEPLPVLPSGASALFVGVVCAVAIAAGIGAWVFGLRLGFPRAGARRLADDVLLGIVVWLGFTGILASRGFFLDFKAVPTRIALAFLIPLIAVFALILSRKLGGYVLAIPLTWLIAIQTFRFPVELVLWRLGKAGVVPALRTIEGANFDILIGMTAPIIAYLSANNIGPRRVAGWWNFIGILLLLNVIAISLLSAPTPWQVFRTVPTNTLPSRFPYIWIPVFLIPFALFAHLAALGSIARSRIRDRKAESQLQPGALR